VFVALDCDPDLLESTNLWCFNGTGANANNIDGAFDSYFQDPANVTPPAVYITFPCAKEDSKAKGTWKERHPGLSNAIIFCDAGPSFFKLP
jgi:hypothetical protein